VKKIVVPVDPDLIDLIPGFLSNKRKDSATIAELADKADYEALRGLGHKLKGEGGGYGLDAISAIGVALEGAAAARDLAAIRRCHSELLAYLEAIEIVADESAAR
jgi:HPt (histidine-containing phosphotransfer) domain-containing protein